MDTIQEARKLLEDAEIALRDLMQREIKAQKYGELGRLASMAEALSRLAEGTPGAGAFSTVPTESRTSSTTPWSAKLSANRRSSSKAAYPMFERDEDRLVKVGWSKKGREEYEHRAPRAAVLAFAEHLGRQTVPGKPFVVEDLLPVHDSTGEELPNYQVYLSLAWLRHTGIVAKKGRDGYVRATDPLDGSVFDTLWNQIPNRA